MNEDPRRRLFRLLEQFQTGVLTTDDFCAAYEHVYNLELDKTGLTVVEAAAFGDVFEKVIWYSPYSDERKEIPNYCGEEDIARVVKAAVRKLTMGVVATKGA